MTMEQLSARERHMLVHLRQAEEFGVSLEYYARMYDLEAKDLHSMKQQLLKKGILTAAEPAKGEEAEKPEKAEKPSAFVPVRIVPSAPAPSAMPVAATPAAVGTACRLVHPSGWTIECGSFPEARWIAAVMSGGVHAAA